MARLGQRDTHLGIQGSHNAGKLLLRIKQGLECSQLKALYLKHYKTPVLPVGADPPSPRLQGGVWGTPGGVCAPWGPQGDKHWRCWVSSLTVTAETRTSHQNVAMGYSVNVFKIKKGRLNPNY